MTLFNQKRVAFSGFLEPIFFEALASSSLLSAYKFRSPFPQAHIHHLGGAVIRQGKQSEPFAHPDSPFVMTSSTCG